MIDGAIAGAILGLGLLLTAHLVRWLWRLINGRA